MVINLDSGNAPISPTLVLAHRNGEPCGAIKVLELKQRFSMNEAGELNCSVNKRVNENNIGRIKGSETVIWDEIKDFKLLHDIEHDTWYEIKVNTNESDDTSKDVSGITLCEAELSQVMLFDIEINTEDDVSRDDYDPNTPTILYRENDPENSLLHRIMEKAPHYTIGHVDETVAGIQRMFSFDDTSIYDAMQEIADEINCIFVFNNGSNSNGKPAREVNVYDLNNYCTSCGYRGTFSGECPECGSSDIITGYGEDTNIFVTSDELADSIELTPNTDSVKNCFKLEAGDDEMTAAIRLSNPNGSDYIYYFSDDVLNNMSDELASAISEYNQKYDHYQSDNFVIALNSELVSRYNSEVIKVFQTMYNESHKNSSGEQVSELTELNGEIKGYAELMKIYYDMVDIYYYLKSELMPTVQMSDTTAQVQLLNVETQLKATTVAVEKLTSSTSTTTVNNAVLSMAKAIVDSRYSVKIDSSSFSFATKKWIGKFIVTNYSAEDEDTAISSSDVAVSIGTDYSSFVKQKIDKLLANSDSDDLRPSTLFSIKDDSAFKDELKKYCRDSLSQFYNTCDACISVMIEQGISGTDNTYKSYRNRLGYIQSEIDLRSSQMSIIFDGNDLGYYDLDDNSGLYIEILNLKDSIRKDLDFKCILENAGVYEEFCMYRREQKYTNSNYISDGLTNSQIFRSAQDFIKQALDELYKSAELQHSISSTLRNLLIIPKFKPLRNYFDVGNWIRVEIDDKLYKLRLLNFTIDYDSLKDIEVTFSDVLRVKNGISDVQSILESASTMATSYGAVARQASRGNESKRRIDDWFAKGLSATNVNIVSNAAHQDQVWNDRGMLFRRWEDTLDDYAPEQIKIINSTIAITDDGWNTIKTAIGKFNYVDSDGNTQTAYGFNGETIIAKSIKAEQIDVDDLFAQTVTATNLTVSGNSQLNGVTATDLTVTGNSTFSGELEGATGKFSGELEGATGKFSGELEAATGTFSGTVSAATITGSFISATDITGGTLKGNTIQSNTYNYSSGNYSTSGIQIELTGNGFIRAKNFGIDSSGNAYFKGDISGSTIQGSKIEGEDIDITSEYIGEDALGNMINTISTPTDDSGFKYIQLYSYAQGKRCSNALYVKPYGTEIKGNVSISPSGAYDGSLDISGNLTVNGTIEGLPTAGIGTKGGIQMAHGSDSVSVPANSYADATVTFSSEFSAAPGVMICRYASGNASTNVSQSAGRSIVLHSVSKSQFKIRCYNNTSATWTSTFRWLAIYRG